MGDAGVNWNLLQSLQICQVKGPDQLPHTASFWQGFVAAQG